MANIFERARKALEGGFGETTQEIDLTGKISFRTDKNGRISSFQLNLPDGVDSDELIRAGLANFNSHKRMHNARHRLVRQPGLISAVDEQGTNVIIPTNTNETTLEILSHTRNVLSRRLEGEQSEAWFKQLKIDMESEKISFEKLLQEAEYHGEGS